MQYTHHMILNFISDSVMQKFLRFAYAKFLNDFFSKMRGRNKNFDFKFEFSVKFCVGLYVMIWGLCWYYRRFAWKYWLRRRKILYSMKTDTNRLQIPYHHIPSDAEFNAESEFEVEIFIPPTHVGEKIIWKFCVGESQKFLNHWIRNKICNHMMCILYMLWVIYES